MEAKRSGTYSYLMVIFSVIILAWAVWAMYNAFNYQQQGNTESFYFYAAASSVAIVLAVSSIMQMRRRIQLLQSLAVKVLSVVLCANCGFKVVRGFADGDFVYKEVGKCQQCSGTMRVDSIYAEEPAKKPRP
jgi:glucan phosphoethanolaminetransferase (alkaline phosphatase superfamily)